MIDRIKQIYIHPDAAQYALTRRVLSNRGNIPYEIAQEVPEISLSSGKRIVFLTSSPGQLVKPCPATASPYLCCQYTVIHSCTQCPMDCTYCVLQNYLESPVITLNVRLPEMFHEIEMLLSQHPKRFFRFGTGELGDSLALDPLTLLSEDFIRFFSSRKNTIIELKTKSINIDHVLNQTPKNTVISWSVNPDPVIQTQELYAPALSARLEAAAQCQNAGYLLGFHFDPILYVPDWKNLYQEVVSQIFNTIASDRVVWISLGSFRFPPALKPLIASRFPGSHIIYEEMIRGLDGKLRYPRPMRIEMYKHLYQCIRNYSSDVFVYFCMELPRVWSQVLGKTPGDNTELDYWFAESLWRRFGSELAMDKPEQEDYPFMK